jgi:hypothetical protein
MDSIRDRAKDQFPTVLLTLLSIVQALALEFLWDHSRHRPELYETSWTALLGWLQIAASLNVIILIWLAYAGMVMRFRWTPTTADSVLPFFVGLIQFLMIDIMGPDKLGRWILVLALIFSTMNFVSHRVMRRARRDLANREFFEQFSPATLRDFTPQIIMIAALILVGSLLWQSGDYGWLAMCALVGSLIGLGYETYNASKYWTYSMGGK